MVLRISLERKLGYVKFASKYFAFTESEFRIKGVKSNALQILFYLLEAAYWHFASEGQ